MSCTGFRMGDTGIVVYATVSGCSGALTSPIVSGTWTFTGPTGSSFEREVVVVSPTQIKYVTVADDFGDGGFAIAGTWRFEAVVTLANGNRRTTSCGSFTIGA